MGGGGSGREEEEGKKEKEEKKNREGTIWVCVYIFFNCVSSMEKNGEDKEEARSGDAI